jgi:alkanesulfonate monooxygenase SsuD/methylene tetrahydromethanopterin reductase-like flavin-dependent oxidoreductase (luciferase family)
VSAPGAQIVKFGVLQIFQNHQSAVSDARMWEEEIALGLLAEELGFDSLWAVEHHFEDYAACPDNTQYLSYMAGRTRRITLATGAVILPWNQPIRVAEKLAMLDQLSGGRVIFGMGRGLARREYEGFGIDMGTSRERFDEAADMVLTALDTGYIEGHGKFYPQARTAIRPRPLRGFRDRMYCIAMSPDSVEAAARIGAGMAIFSQSEWPKAAESINRYRELFEAAHGRKPPPPLTADFVVCDYDAGRAEELARKHIAGYLLTVFQHYELMSDHFKQAKGYKLYGDTVDLLRAVGLETLAHAYVDVQAWGTPDQIIAKLKARREIIGEFCFNACFRYTGIPFEAAERSMRLFARDVIPALR